MCEYAICIPFFLDSISIHFYRALSNEMNKMISKTARKTPYFNLLLLIIRSPKPFSIGSCVHNFSSKDEKGESNMIGFYQSEWLKCV